MTGDEINHDDHVFVGATRENDQMDGQVLWCLTCNIEIKDG